MKVNRLSINDILIYNTLTKKKEKFFPIQDNEIKLYVCGITAYDYSHLGHARVYVFFDLAHRFFKALGFNVTYVRNITDIDDKIFDRCAITQETPFELTKRVMDSFHHDEKILSLLSPNFEPRVTEHIEGIIQMISDLINLGYAYVTSKGNVYYSVKKFDDYGKLSGKVVSELREGVRIDPEDDKQDVVDFALWKAFKGGKESSWAAPWGEGRPGWHIECSTMAKHFLGESFDIHGGGPDLIFPHHENEIAQSEALTKKQMAKYWMHVGSLQVDNDKMSKSLGNFIALSDAIKEHGSDLVKYFLISSHYRSQLNYSNERIWNFKKALDKITSVFISAIEDNLITYDAWQKISLSLESDFSDNSEPYPYYSEFIDALKDDFNTPKALSLIFNLVKKINSYAFDISDRNASNDDSDNIRLSLIKQLKLCLNILGICDGVLVDKSESDMIFSHEDKKLNKLKEINLEEEYLLKLIRKREEARATKEWSKADKIRNELQALGISLEDTADGTKWDFI